MADGKLGKAVMENEISHCDEHNQNLSIPQSNTTKFRKRKVKVAGDASILEDASASIKMKKKSKTTLTADGSERAAEVLIALKSPAKVRPSSRVQSTKSATPLPPAPEFPKAADGDGVNLAANSEMLGTVGEDDLGEVIFDYDDIVKIPYLKALIERLTSEAVKLRTEASGEVSVSNQDVHFPGIRPKFPGRFYYLFGKPIETKGLHGLKDREKSQELYLRVKSEVEACMSYLKEKREMDPYRNIIQRLVYQAAQGFTSEVPTFDID